MALFLALRAKDLTSATSELSANVQSVGKASRLTLPAKKDSAGFMLIEEVRRDALPYLWDISQTGYSLGNGLSRPTETPWFHSSVKSVQSVVTDSEFQVGDFDRW
jgi:hypothetical protein